VLGHRTPVTTLNTYAHVMPGADKKAQKTHGMAGSRTRTSFRTADFRTTMAFATATFAFVVRTVP
jgi:hypothetical protein